MVNTEPVPRLRRATTERRSAPIGLPDAARRALVRAWYAAGAEGFDWIPRPPSGGHVFALGRDPIQILLVGGGLAVGWGVASHDLAPAGFLARELAGRTGRGTDVLVIAGRDVDVRSAPDVMAAVDLPDFDHVVLMLGVEDAVRGIRPTAWRRHITQVLRMARTECAPAAVLHVAAIQPIRSVPAYDHPLGESADAHAATLNVITASACAAVPGAVFVPLPADPSMEAGVRRTPKNYPYWGRLLAKSIAEVQTRHVDVIGAAAQETA